MNKLLQKFKLVALAVSASTLFACGGGGDGNSSTPAPTIVYTGVTTEAVITSTNASAFGANLFAPTNNTNPVTLNSVSSKSNSISKNIASINQSLTSKIQSEITILTSGFTTFEVVTQNGFCVSGTQVTTLDINRDTGAFTGTINFSNCVATDGSSINGLISSSGSFNVSNGTLNKLSISFTSLIIKNATGFFEMSGTMNIEGNSTTINIAVQDKTTNQIVKLENFVMITDISSPNASVTFSVKYYHSDYGYVTITTPQPIVVPANATYPNAGQILITGASEITNQKATIEYTYLPGDTYTIKIDYDGDGAFEVDQTCNWTQDCVIPTAP